LKATILMDTGPLVAFLNRRDRQHGWTVRALEQLQAPFVTCESVLSEACFLLRKTSGGTDAVMELVARGLIRVPFHFDSEAPAIRRLLARYANVPMSFADACLVRMAEQFPSALLLTLDRDFKFYRRNGRQTIPLAMPDTSTRP
jgi:predicted nucleic acid-binding protein